MCDKIHCHDCSCFMKVGCSINGGNGINAQFQSLTIEQMTKVRYCGQLSANVCGLRHLLWVIVYNWVLRHLLCQIPGQFFVASRKKKSLFCIWAPNTKNVFDPLARVDGSTPHPPGVYVHSRWRNSRKRAM